MATSERALQELDCVNLANNWPNWKRNFIVYMIATGKSTEPETTKIANFIWLIGTNGANIYNRLYPNDGSQNELLGTVRTGDTVIQRTLDEVLAKFDQHCLPQGNIAMESYKFNVITQKEKQTFMEFETELRTQVRHCNFVCECGASYENRMLRDRIIAGVHEKKLQLKLLDGGDEQLSCVVNTCKTYEAANANKGISDLKKSVNAIAKSEKPKLTPIAANNRVCFNCGGPWKLGHMIECKAKDVTCRSCVKKGHFAKNCRKNMKDTTNTSTNAKNNNGDKEIVAGINWKDVEGWHTCQPTEFFDLNVVTLCAAIPASSNLTM